MKKKTVVQGYTIIERKRAGEVMVVVGHNPKAPQPYVTWKAYAHDNFQSFETGNYFFTLKDAMVDYYKRLATVWEYFYVPIQKKPPKTRKDEPPVR